MSGANAGTHHNCHRCGKSQGTGTGYHQYRNGRRQGKFQTGTCKHPYTQRHRRYPNDHRYKYSRYLICKLRNRRLAGAGLLHQTDNLGQGGIFSHPVGPAFQKSCLVHGGRHHLIPLMLFHRHALSRNRRLIDAGAALHHRGIHRHKASRFYQENISCPQLLRGNFHLPPVFRQQNCGLGRQIHKFCNRLTGLPLRTALQVLSHCNQRQYHTR